MNTVTLDVTILKSYKGNLTGISRTIFFTIAELIKNKKTPFNGMVFNRTSNEFLILTRTEFQDLLATINKELKLGLNYIEENINNLDSSNQLLLMGELWCEKNSIAHLKKLKKNNVKIISFIHDLIPFFEQHFYWDDFVQEFIQWGKDTLEISDYFITQSQSSKRDIEKILNEMNLNKEVHLATLGDNILKGNATTFDLKLPSQNFILCVGTVQPRKNHMLLFLTWKKLVAELKENCPDLLIIGSKGWHVDDFYYFCSTDKYLKNKIHFIEKVTDPELYYLYQSSMLTVYPSFYEGWGLPIAESVAIGKYCIPSNSSSMTEIAGDLLEYHDPYNPIELFEKIKFYSQNPEELKKKEKLIRENYKIKTWENFTNTICNILNN